MTLSTIEHDVHVSDLIQHPNNPRRGDIEAIKASMRTVGWYGVVIRQASTGYMLAGNHRVPAWAALGHTTVPTVETLDVDDATAARILAFDNRTSDRATYDDDAHAALLRTIRAEGPLPKALYDSATLARLGINDGPIVLDDHVGKDDEYYTPAHVFERLGLTFDLDVAAPPRRHPARTSGPVPHEGRQRTDGSLGGPGVDEPAVLRVDAVGPPVHRASQRCVPGAVVARQLDDRAMGGGGGDHDGR